MTPKLPIYLDHNATTPVDPRVFEAMRPFFCQTFGNAASKLHPFGEAARQAVENARAQVAGFIGAEPGQIVWTSGATESDNLAIKGVAEACKAKGRHIITQVTEHKAVLDTCQRLQRQGYEVTYLPVSSTGRVSAEQVAQAIRPDTFLVSIMLANNEIGTIQPIRQIGQVCREKGVLFHSDATQGFGKIPIDVEADYIDLMSFSGHKIYGPKGCGGLYVREKRKRLRDEMAQMHGGGHENGLRSGTLNVPGIVGLGAACESCRTDMAGDADRQRQLRDRLEQSLLQQLNLVTVNGDRDHRLPQTTNMSFAYVEGESILLAMNDVALSTGSACMSDKLEPSYVLTALGVDTGLAHCSIRFSLGRFTTVDEVDYTVAKMVREITRLREMSPLYEMAMEGIDPGKVQWAEH